MRQAKEVDIEEAEVVKNKSEEMFKFMETEKKGGIQIYSERKIPETLQGAKTYQHKHTYIQI